MTNTDRARRWYAEVWAPGGEAVVDELMAENVVGSMEGLEIRSRDEFHAAREQLLSTFTDLTMSVDDVIEEGDKVAVRWHVNATHGGDGLGMPATHRRVAVRGISWIEFENGQITRGWDSWNLGALLQSLAAPAD